MPDDAPEKDRPLAPVGGSAEPPEGTPKDAAAGSPAAEMKETAKPPAPAAPTASATPAGTKPAAPAARPAVPAAPKEPAIKPLPLDNELVQRMKSRFGAAIQEAWLDRKQSIIVVARGLLAEVARSCRDDEEFDMLTDLTAVDWPKREKRFDVVLNLYSFARNERLRIKAMAGENESIPSLCAVWPAANWMEREVFDMFGIVFEGHPNLQRILMPDEWEGYPLRKDYDILRQDTAWVRENLGIESGQ